MFRQARYRWVLIGCGLLLLGGALVVAAVAYWKRDELYWRLARRPAAEELTKLLGGEQVAAILQQPERVEAARIRPPNVVREWQPQEYDELELRDPVPADVAADISQALLAPEANRNVPPKSCIPVYGVRVSYLRGMDRVDLYFCFECALVTVHLNDQAVGGNAFDFSFRRLIADAQKLFPYDQELPRLASEWRR